jgi:hypothetical protein
MASHNQTGRSKKHTGGFVSLPYSVMESAGYRSASPVARAVLIEFIRIHNGKNNGFLALSSRRIADRINASKDTASRAIRELINRGLLRLTKASSFSQKRLAAEYRLTHLQCNKTNEMPSKEYLSHKKPSQNAAKEK